MCTLSWCYHPLGYSVFFNRDEQRTRAHAIAAAEHSASDSHAVYPVDPKGGGTWLAVNAAGVTFALLNYYQGSLPDRHALPNGAAHALAPISRGKIITSLLRANTIAHVESQFSKLNLSRFAAFTLVMFAKHESPLTFKWDGNTLEQGCPVSPVISSAVELPVVQQKRLALYDELYQKANQQQAVSADTQHGCLLSTHREFHRSHLPSKSQYSVCMHRGDAKSVSYSEIHVNEATASFKYVDQSPCSADAQNTSVCDLALI